MPIVGNGAGLETKPQTNSTHIYTREGGENNFYVYYVLRACGSIRVPALKKR